MRHWSSVLGRLRSIDAHACRIASLAHRKRCPLTSLQQKSGRTCSQIEWVRSQRKRRAAASLLPAATYPLLLAVDRGFRPLETTAWQEGPEDALKSALPGMDSLSGRHDAVTTAHPGEAVAAVQA